MTVIRRTTRAEIGTGSSDRMVTVTINTQTVGRDNFVMMSGGVDLTAYRTNPVVLWQHEPDWPVASAIEIGVVGENVVAQVKFPDAGISQRADEVYGLIRAGVINAASTGVDIIESEPIDPGNRNGGVRIVRCELQEFSFVSVPAVPDALITERAMEEVQNRMADKNRKSVATAEQLNTVQAEMIQRSAVKAVIVKRGLYEVGRLAYLLEELGWTKCSSEWEADVEQDGSTVPAQLGEALKMLGEVLIAMTVEEVGELVGAPEPDVGEADPAETEYVEQAASPGTRRFRRGAYRMQRRGAVPVAKPATQAAARSIGFHRRMATLFAKELTSA